MSDEDKKEEPMMKNAGKGLDKFDITTDGMGGWGLVSGDKSQLSPEQLEWCENMARLAASKGLKGQVSYGAKPKVDEKSSKNAVGANVGESVHPHGNMWNKLKKDFEQIGRGFVRDMTDLTKTPFQMAKDLYTFGKMVAQGKTRDAVGKAANKIYANLKGMIGLESENESKLYGINKFANRTVKQALEPYKQMGRNVKALFQRLSGRGEAATAKVPVSEGKLIRGRDSGGR